MIKENIAHHVDYLTKTSSEWLERNGSQFVPIPKEKADPDAEQREMNLLTWKREQLEKTKHNLNELEKHMDQSLEDCSISKDEILDSLLNNQKQ